MDIGVFPCSILKLGFSLSLSFMKTLSLLSLCWNLWVCIMFQFGFYFPLASNVFSSIDGYLLLVSVNLTTLLMPPSQFCDESFSLICVVSEHLDFSFFLINFPKMFTGIMILSYIFESYLDLRQHAAHKLPNLPKTLEGVISQEKFEKSRAYSLDKRFVSVFLLSLLGSLHALFMSSDPSMFYPLSLSFPATSILFTSFLPFSWTL